MVGELQYVSVSNCSTVGRFRWGAGCVDFGGERPCGTELYSQLLVLDWGDYDSGCVVVPVRYAF